MMSYRFGVFRDAGLSERVERLSLSAPSDAVAVEQAEAARWRRKCAGESRVLALPRGGREDAKLGDLVAAMERVEWQVGVANCVSVGREEV